MCTTNQIQNIFLPASKYKDLVPIMITRSDGLIFSLAFRGLTENENEKVRELIKHIEEIRSCDCKEDKKCELHDKVKDR